MYLPDSLEHSAINVRRPTSFRDSGNSAGAIESFPRQEFSTLPRKSTSEGESEWLPKLRWLLLPHLFSEFRRPPTIKRSLAAAAADLEHTVASVAFTVAEISTEVSEGFAVEALVPALEVLSAAENFGVVSDVLGAGSAFMVAGILTFHTGTAATLIPTATDATEVGRCAIVRLGRALARPWSRARCGRIASEIDLSNFNRA